PGTGRLTVLDREDRLIGSIDVRAGDDLDAAARRVVLREKAAAHSGAVFSSSTPASPFQTSKAKPPRAPADLPVGWGGFLVSVLNRDRRHDEKPDEKPQKQKHASENCKGFREFQRSFFLRPIIR